MNDGVRWHVILVDPQRAIEKGLSFGDFRLYSLMSSQYVSKLVDRYVIYKQVKTGFL